MALPKWLHREIWPPKPKIAPKKNHVFEFIDQKKNFKVRDSHFFFADLAPFEVPKNFHSIFLKFSSLGNCFNQQLPWPICRKVWHFSFGNWNTQKGLKKLNLEPILKHKQLQLLWQLSYIENVKSRIKGKGEGIQGVNCMGVIEGNRASIQEAKKIQVRNLMDLDYGVQYAPIQIQQITYNMNNI